METQVQQVNQYDLTEFDKVAADIERMKEKGNFIPNCTTEDGYLQSKRLVLDITTPGRRSLEHAHKLTKAPFLATSQFLDKKKRELMALIISIETPHMEAYKAVDKAKVDAKLAKQKAIQDKINLLDTWVGEAYDVACLSGDIFQLLDKCAHYELDDEFFGDRLGEAEHAQAHALKKLEDRLQQQLKVEQAEEEQAKREVQAEKDRLAKEESDKKLAAAQKIINDKKAKEAEKKRVDELVKIHDANMERIRIEHEANIKIEKESQETNLKKTQERIKEAQDRANKEAIAAKEKADQDAKDAAEAARLAQIKKQNDDIEAERLARERREKDKAHKGGIMRAAKEALMAVGLDEKTAKRVVLAIHKEQVPYVSISY